MKDKYDEAIEYLTANPRTIPEFWGRGESLFQFITRSGAVEVVEVGGNKNTCGCLTQIRRNKWMPAATESLTARIRADERIPKSPCDITPSNLHVFAEWQRIADKELGRV